MNPILLLIVVVSILSSIANKKRKEEMKKKAQQAPYAPGGQRSAAPASVSRQTKPASASAAQKAQKSTRGVDSKWPWPTAEEKAQSKPKPAASTYSGTPRYTHVVTSTLEGGHTHTESSMTGEEDCPPPEAAVAKAEQKGVAPPANAVPLLSFQTSSVLHGVLFAEILGKPKALQRE